MGKKITFIIIKTTGLFKYKKVIKNYWIKLNFINRLQINILYI